MDNLPRATARAQADASAWMAFFARYLTKIAEEVGDPASAARYAADLDTIVRAVNRTLWDETAGFYFDLDDSGRAFIPTVSYIGLVPLIAGIVPADRLARVLGTLRDPAQLLSPYGVRSVSARSVIYEPGYASRRGVNSNWRGPIWVPINYLLVEALTPLDPELAATVRERVVATVRGRLEGHRTLPRVLRRRDRGGPRGGRPDGLDGPRREPDRRGLAGGGAGQPLTAGPWPSRAERSATLR